MILICVLLAGILLSILFPAAMRALVILALLIIGAVMLGATGH